MQQPLPSVSNNYINVTGVAAAIVAFFVCQYLRADALATAFALCIAFAGTVLLLEVVFLKTYLRPSTGLDWNKCDYNIKRVAIKCLGLYGTFVVLGIIYYLSPEYHDFHYRAYWRAVAIMLPVVLTFSVPYIAIVDARMKVPQDGLYHFGLCLLGKWSNADYDATLQHILAWMVKGFFLPLMWIFLVKDMHFFSVLPYQSAENFVLFFYIVTTALYTIDVTVGIVGYVVSFRVFDNHIRSTDSSVFGWAVCIICYMHFIGYLQVFFNDYSQYPWVIWFADYPIVIFIWSVALIFLLYIYVASTVNFGCRFSNLTNRGILTNGMFRFSKHPAYISKNLGWWLLSAPFIPLVDARTSISYTLCMLALNGIYLLRARAEEYHLSSDPDYVNYALNMNEHSIFRFMTLFFPWMLYKAPKK